MIKKVKVLILYRVLAHYRLALFEKLGAYEEIDLHVMHGCDFPGTKVLNSKAKHRLNAIELESFPIRVKTSNGTAVAPFSPGLLRQLIALKPDVVICEGASNLPNNLLVYIYKLFSRVRVVQWGLGELKGRKKSILRRALDGIIVKMEKSANACVAYSSRGKEYFERIGVDPSRIFIAVNVVDTDKILESVATMDVRSIYDDGHQSTDFVVLFVGALNVEKKVDVLINAFKQFVGDTRANAKLVIVGEGSDRNRLEALTAQGLKADIEFTGKVIEGVARYFLMADIFVLPGLGGLAVSEAMAYGVPVIASIGDGCEQDLLADGGGILDESLDELSLVGHLKSLYEDPKLRRLMADNAKATIINRYNTRSYLEGLIQAIKR